MRGCWPLAALLFVVPLLAAAQNEPDRSKAAAPAEAAAPELPLATNRRSFLIPVSVERSGREYVPAEVHLLVSGDQGKAWATYARQKVDSKGFQFKASADGEYWFASRTVDAQGHARPAKTEAELKIIVDSAQPKVELQAAVVDGEHIKAAWKITDVTPLPEGVRLEYQPGDSLKPTWQSVPLEAGSQQLSGGVLTGSATWSPTSKNRVIDVRIVAQDRAGNLGTDLSRVLLPRRSDQPVARSPEPALRSAPAAKENVSGDPFTPRQFGEGGTYTAAKPKVAAAPSLDTPKTGSVPWPADNTLPAPPASIEKIAAKPPALSTEPLARAPGEVSPPVGDRVVAKPSSTGGSSPLIWNPDRSEEPAAKPAIDGPSSDVTDEQFPKIDVPTTSGDKPQLTSSRSFSLDYDVDSVGPSGLKAAELWVTVDSGRNWEKWGEDEDKRSPFQIQVQSERTFGFRMVIVANNGLATRPPQAGDPADIFVAVDSTKPRVRLTQAAYGQGENAGKLDVRWEADDEHLGSRAVTLAFSETPEGPFTTLAAGLANSGQHYWTIDPHTPRKLYLRLEVRDEAGNVGVDQTAEPVSLEGLSPKGRIKAVLPGNAGASKGIFRSPLFR